VDESSSVIIFYDVGEGMKKVAASPRIVDFTSDIPLMRLQNPEKL